MKGIRAPVEDVGDFRHGAGRAVGQPFARHPGAVAQRVEPRVVDGRARRRFSTITGTFARRTTGKHGGRQRVGGDVQENQVHVGLAEAVPGLGGLLRRVDQTRG